MLFCYLFIITYYNIKKVQKTKLIAVVGPTASGKSELAVEIAKKFGGEIVSADSRQVYRGMDIGTAKITQDKMQGIPHHLLDIAKPTEQFTAADYVRLAKETISGIAARGKLPIICGGTGFYIDALLHNINIPKVPPQPELRKELGRKSAEKLHKELRKRDPRRAENIDPQNKRRLIRALEIVYATGKPVPKPADPAKAPYDVLFIGVSRTRETLKKRIAERVDKRLGGIVQETKTLHDARGVPWKRLDSFGLEYRWAARFLQRKVTRKEMRDKLITDTWRYAKKQLTWCEKHPVKWVKDTKEAAFLIQKSLKTPVVSLRECE